MKVLITGASGRLADFVIRELASQHELVLTSRRKPSDEFSNLPWIQGDLNSFEDCQRAVQGVEAIQHLGAQPGPVDHPNMRAGAEERGIPFDTTFKTNMLGTYYLMQAAIEASVGVVVMAGSNCALGHGFRISDTPFPIRALPIDEIHPCSDPPLAITATFVSTTTVIARSPFCASFRLWFLLLSHPFHRRRSLVASS